MARTGPWFVPARPHCCSLQSRRKTTSGMIDVRPAAIRRRNNVPTFRSPADRPTQAPKAKKRLKNVSSGMPEPPAMRQPTLPRDNTIHPEPDAEQAVHRPHGQDEAVGEPCTCRRPASAQRLSYRDAEARRPTLPRETPWLPPRRRFHAAHPRSACPSRPPPARPAASAHSDRRDGRCGISIRTVCPDRRQARH
jgi:hypothetical protein